ncbi:tfiiic transcription initiation factor complex subunit [Ophiostoma piceae UAMH 11346]|uniref:Tfiiic transcription initiation factor complex subunit n=1 Tax=Ophiostoma piceae (strain UAMH 11346) TaxID=1262450 RepID=S3BUV0_OPHP1|nr:tfiiic transcription initiation factor complex subunit [Ophiostoma piceae UAMH 11346]
MAKGLDELIDWLVAETAYCGETGLSVADFVAAVSRFFDGPKPVQTDDNALARRAWEWLVERPEILVGRHGCRGRMTLDEALALPEPVPVDDGLQDIKVEVESAANTNTNRTTNTNTPGKAKSKKVSFAIPKTAEAASPAGTKRRVSGAQRAAAAAATEDPLTRPRLYATEETIWHALTGHDVDHKKIPPLEWKCLMGIASARADGILQGDLRALVDQDKRSVPKRTDFLASKGYAIKRTTIARGYRTSMLWLTEFAPAELDAEAAPQEASSTSSAMDTAGLDLSPEFLRKNLDPVPWRNRWIGDAIEFASFGQTILAIIKAWDVIRVVDLKHKLGIIGQRWQMRTLARACREFVESGILRFVAAMRADERKLFKDCIKYERDPTPQEWAVYLAAGRRRGPITEVRAKHRRDQERRIRSESVATTSMDQSVLGASESVFGDSAAGDSLVDDAEYDEESFGLEAAARAMWEPGVPLLNLVFDTVEKAGTAGITSPEICRLTVGTRYSRYMFSLINALSKAGNQPPHLACFQLHCEPDRVGKNKAYLFRTLENYKRAKQEEAIAASDEGGPDAMESTVKPANTSKSRAPSPARDDASQQAVSLHDSGELAKLPASEVRRLFGFTAAPVSLSAGEAMDRLNEVIAARKQSHRRLGRPRKPESERSASSKARSKNKGTMGTRRGRPPKKAIPQEVDSDLDDVPTPPKRPRGRPKKIRDIEVEADTVAEEDADTEMADAEAADDEPPEADAQAEIKAVRLGEPNSLTQRTPGKRGRKPRSIVLIFKLDELEQADFLAQQKGYKDGAIRELPESDDEMDVDVDVDEDVDEIQEPDELGVPGEPEKELEEEVGEEVEEPDEPEEAEEPPAPAQLLPVEVLYHGAPGTLTVDRASKTLTFTPTIIRRRGRPKANQPARPAAKDPIVIDVANLASDPAIRGVPGTNDKALVVDVKEVGSPVWPFTFVLSDSKDDGNSQADLLLHVLLQMHSGEDEDDDTVAVSVPAAAPAPAPAPAPKASKAAKAAKHAGPYVCEKCNNTWKNLLGLQYHQTKARTPCNPDYVPPAPNAQAPLKTRLPKEAKKDAANETELSSSRPRLRERKSMSFAEMDVDGDVDVTEDTGSDAGEGAVDSENDVLPVKKKAGSKTGPRRRLLEAESTEQLENGAVPCFRGITGASKVSSAPRKLQPLPPRAVEAAPVAQHYDEAAEPIKTPTDKRPRVLFPTEQASASPRGPAPEVDPSISRPQTPTDRNAPPTLSAYPSPTPIRDMPSSIPSAVSTPFKSAPMTAALAASTILNSPGVRKPAPFRMPPLPRNYAKASIFILRSLRTVEIIRYLVSCYDDGVFPSDRSLWYACYAIYTKTFPGEDPPTLNVTKASLKKLELAKVVEEHTFGFRDARGQFIYCRLVARPGTELFQSETAKEMKRNIQAAYPKPFVPAEFAPSIKDLAVLRVMDKEFDRETPKNVRGRRTLAPEIEVLKAPVYEKPAPTRTSIKTVLVVDYDEEDEDENENSSRPSKKVKGTPGRKRKAVSARGANGGEDGDDFAGALSRVSHGTLNTTPGSANSRKRRAKFADFIAGKAEARWARRDMDSLEDGGYGDDDPNDMDTYEEDDIDANIDPLLRDLSTKRIRSKPGPRSKAKRLVNPGLDTLPDSFFSHGSSAVSTGSANIGSLASGTALHRNNKNRPAHLRAAGPDGHATFVHFLPPNTALGEDHSMQDLQNEYTKVTLKRRPFPPPRVYKIVTKMFTLEDNRRTESAQNRDCTAGTSIISWPNITETILQRHSDSSFTMDGFMPTAKSLVRANLPQSAAECASLLRKNHVLAGISALAQDYGDDMTPAERMLLDIDYCRAWELSQPGTDLLNNPSIEPKYVFLNMDFAGTHHTTTSDDYVGAALWVPENQYTVETLPYVALEEEELVGDMDRADTGAGANLATSPVARHRNTAAANAARSRDTLAQRDRQARQARQAKYVMSSRREMTAYPQGAGDYVPVSVTNADIPDAEWNSDEALMAAFIAVRTLLGGLGNSVDWGLMMRLFPDHKLSALRTFWSTQRKRKQVYIDKYTERFQSDFLDAYDDGTLPPIDYDNVVGYDWHRLVRWTMNMIRHSAAITLPATRAELEDKYAIVDMVASAAAAPSTSGSATQAISASLQQASAPAVPSWREDYFHVARSVWNRLQDSAGEAAYKPIDAAVPSTPAEAAAAMAAGRPGALDALRFMVARSWIRALCGTPHDRYKPALIKEKLLSLRRIGIAEAEASAGTETAAGSTEQAKTDEAKTNALLQIVIGNLTHARILRRSKSMVAVSGRMYQMAELYETTLDKAAMEEKFRQAWAFKQKLDGAFRRGEPMELPTNANDDGMMMALVNLQAHGRIALEAVDAPHVPFGFEPGNYETRKFPKHYQRFRQHIVPTPDYVYNASLCLDVDPIWRDFFGVLDRQWFTRLASAVVFSLATRGATPPAQTAAHLRPVIEPFEVQMITDWASRAGILKPLVAGTETGPSTDADAADARIKVKLETDVIDHPPGSATVTEWWWLLVGKMYTAVEEKKGARAKAKAAEKEADEVDEVDEVDEADEADEAGVHGQENEDADMDVDDERIKGQGQALSSLDPVQA